MTTRVDRLRLTLLGCVLSAAIAAAADTQNSPPGGTHWVSARGLFRLQVVSDIEPLVINRMHGWQLNLLTKDGEPVPGAVIRIAGGMPQHDHGLPTAPRVTESDVVGQYRIEGLRFHMRGEWQIALSIDAQDTIDSFDIALQL